jgi:hypothetical protein
MPEAPESRGRESDVEERPLGSYSALSATWAATFAAALIAARRAGHEPPERIAPWDVVAVGAATQKLSRLITKAKITSFVRAPFVEDEGAAGYGELSERPAGKGPRRAIGELLVCPYCLSNWIASGFGVGLVAAPRTTRLIAAIYTAEAIADFLQLAYKAAEDRS